VAYRRRVRHTPTVPTAARTTCGRRTGQVAGLYAAGACASNIAQDGKGYSTGTQLGEGSFFGRRAGAHAATYGGST
jgi:succinate dehydrogenase/fumarate reductase flavoprotein subunit